MKQLTCAFIFAVVFLAVGTAEAQAGFLVAPIVAFIGLTGTAAAVATAVGGLVVAVGVSYVANKLLAPDPPKPSKIDSAAQRTESGASRSVRAGGVQLDIRVDADIPQSFGVGRFVTGGSLFYAETFGSRGEIDNSDLIEGIAISDLPCTGLVQVYVDGQGVGLTDAGARGQVVNGYADKLALRFFDGTQTAADSFAVSKLGLHSQRPWTDKMVGRGRAYVRTHAIYDQEKVPGRMRWRFVADGVKLYDPRQDSTVGGAGAQRFELLETHAFTRNLPLIAYNILRGIYVKDHTGTRRLYYGAGVAAADLPLDVWIAAMNEADALVDGEPQFWGGAEIALNTEPLEIIKEILRACGGRLVEIGGVYKLYVGPPGLPVMTFDDGALRADEADTAKPVLPLDQRVNYISGSYTRPEDGWISRVGPPRIDTARVAADGRVGADLDVPLVQSGKHFQRLQKQLLANAAKERRHTLPLPPAAWGIEPGDVVEWTSALNGYASKLFTVEQVRDDHSLNSTATVVEVDHADYDWTPATDLIAEADGVLDVARPAPKEVGSFSVSGVANVGTNNTVRPAIRVSWDDPADADVTAIRVAYRIAGQVNDPGYGFSYEPASGQLLITNLQPATNYEVKAQFESFNGWATEATPWLPVVTPDIRFSRDDFDAAVNARMAQLDSSEQAALATLIAQLDGRLSKLAQHLLGQVAKLEDQDQSYQMTQGAAVNLVTEEVADEKEARAAAIQSVEAAIVATATSLLGQIAVVDDKHEALATLFGQVFAENQEGAASALFRLIAHAAPQGVAARIALEAKTAAGAFGDESAALFLDVVAGVGALATIKADAFRVQTQTGFAPVLDVQGDSVKVAGNVGIEGDAIVDGTVTGAKIAANAVTTHQLAANAVQAGNIAANAVQAVNIAAHTITADRIVVNGITQSAAGADSVSGAAASSWSTVATLTITKDGGVRAVMFMGIIAGNLGGQPSGGQTAFRMEGRLLRGGAVMYVAPVTTTILAGGAFTIPMTVGFNPWEVPNGTHTMQLQVRGTNTAGLTKSASGRLFAMLPRA